jgi:diguanylate cyclase (GGDEF)-like protein
MRSLEPAATARSDAIDPLTGILNRRHLIERLAVAVVSAIRSGARMAILLVDVDGLKRLNDRFGRLAGDRALRSVAVQIHRTLRGEDLVGRYGGNEFVVLARVRHAGAAKHLAERVRDGIEGLHLSEGPEVIRATVSVGIASSTELAWGDEHVLGLIAMAGARLNEAKALGGNRVCP